MDTGVVPNTTYYYRVRATNIRGDSGYSNESSASTATDWLSIPVASLTLWLKADADVTRDGVGLEGVGPADPHVFALTGWAVFHSLSAWPANSASNIPAPSTTS